MKSTLFFTVIGLISMAANVQAGCSSCDSTTQYCYNGKCYTKRNFGQYCENVNYKPNSWCKSGKCLNNKCGCSTIQDCNGGRCSNGACISRSSDTPPNLSINSDSQGSICNLNSNCNSGFFCNSNNICEKKKIELATCSYAYECVSGKCCGSPKKCRPSSFTC